MKLIKYHNSSKCEHESYDCFSCNYFEPGKNDYPCTKCSAINKDLKQCYYIEKLEYESSIININIGLILVTFIILLIYILRFDIINLIKFLKVLFY